MLTETKTRTETCTCCKELATRVDRTYARCPRCYANCPAIGGCRKDAPACPTCDARPADPNGGECAYCRLG